AALTLAPAAIVWRAVPLQAYVQFPWRLLGFAGAFAAAAIGVTWAAAIAPSLRAPWRWAPALAASIAIFVAGRPYGKLPQAIAAADVPETPRAIQALAKSATVVDEYTPAAVFPIPRRPRPCAAQVIGRPPRAHRGADHRRRRSGRAGRGALRLSRLARVDGGGARGGDVRDVHQRPDPRARAARRPLSRARGVRLHAAARRSGGAQPARAPRLLAAPAPLHPRLTACAGRALRLGSRAWN